ncbi:uncharacterized protein LOC130451117 [Diorhabda sublineata]|uniref:uncharacterized protein LOC130451117 n=1 Tax=Diorhabda sublineata TaxID=1163346 RepID=UPI0024E0AF96|nr:uncharacterized protein LOC130451117 [Diorhabda sublineata]
MIEYEYEGSEVMSIREIGSFGCDKKTWLEYSSHMESIFSKYKVRKGLKKLICIEAMGAKIFDLLTILVRPKYVANEDVTYDFIINKLERYFHPKQDVHFYVTKFQLRKQRYTETFFEYVTALRKIMANCNFSRKNQLRKLRNQLISGCDEDLKSKFNPHSMSLSQLFEVGLLWDDSNIIKPPPHPRNHKARKNRIAKCFRCAQAKTLHNNEPCVFDWANCSHCNVNGHVSIACKYKDTICDNCSEKGHVHKLCKKPAVVSLTSSLHELTIANAD